MVNDWVCYGCGVKNVNMTWVPCCKCFDNVRVCFKCAYNWVNGEDSVVAPYKRIYCVVCDRDRKLGEVLDG